MMKENFMIRLLSYNIHKGFNSLGTRFVLHQIKEILQETTVDLLLLQEVVGENHDHSKNIKNWPTEAQFEFLADSNWPHYSYGKNAVYPARHHGNAVLSKYPIIYSHNTNLTINNWEMRGLLHCEIDVATPDGNQKVHLLNVHLDLLHGSRMQQLHQIVRYIQAHIRPNEKMILAGDFNDWSSLLTQHFQQLLQLKEAFQVLHGLHARSFPSFYPFLKLDRIYFRNIQPHSAKVLDHKPWSSLSDHLPLYFEFKIT